MEGQGKPGVVVVVGTFVYFLGFPSMVTSILEYHENFWYLNSLLRIFHNSSILLSFQSKNKKNDEK